MANLWKALTLLVLSYVFISFSSSLEAAETNFTLSILEPPENTVTLSVEPDGAGELDGAGVYEHGESVTVEVISTNPGYTFLNWTENGNIVAHGEVYTFTLTEDRDLVANFQPDQYLVSVSANPSSGGSVTGGGIYDHNTSVSVEATTNAGYTFLNWTENGTQVSANPTYTFVIGGNRDLVANYEINEYTVNVAADPSAGGSVTGGGVYTYGTSITVSASTNTGYEFVEWREGNNRVSTSSSYSFNVSADRNLRAIFQLKSYTISASVQGNGSVSGTGSYSHGSQVTLTANPNVGNAFVEWREGGSRVSRDSTYGFTATSNRSFTAVFERHTYTINLSTEGNGSVTGAGTYQHGQSVNVAATPAQGHHFVRWREGNQEVSRASSFSFTATRNRTLVAVFAVTTAPPPPPTPSYTIDATAGESGSIEPEGNISVQEGAERTFLMVPDAGYGVYDVFVDDESKGRISEYTLDNISTNHTIHVDFANIVSITVEDGDGGRWALSRRYLDDLMPGDQVNVRLNDIEVYDGYDFERLVIIEEGGSRMSIGPENFPYSYVVSNEDATFRFEFTALEPSRVVTDEDEDDVIVEGGFVTRTASRLSAAVTTSPSNTVQAIRNLEVDDRTVQTGSSVVGATVVPITLLSLLSSQFGVYYYMLQLFLNLLGVLGIRKKGQPYAVVYNSVTKEPINRAIMRVYDKDGKMVHTDVSNVFGVFSRELDSGEYKVEVFARGFTFPSNVVSGSTDSHYQNVFTGGLIKVDNDRPMRYAIPVDPHEYDRIKYAKAILVNRLTNYVSVFQKILVLLGFALSLFVYLRVPSVFNLVVLTIYIPLLFLTFISFFGREKSYGRVEVRGGDLDRADVILGLRELEFETLVDKRICGYMGKYRFLAPGGKYRVEVMNPGYKLSQEHVYEGPKNKPLVINDNLVVEKVEE